MTTIKKAQRLENSMRMSLAPYKTIWSEVDKYVSPRKLATHGDGGINIIDSTGTRALRVLAQGMMSGLTSPAKPWFSLKLSERHGPESEPERNWLNIVESRIYAALARSNFYPTLQSTYAELAAFGAANIYQEVGHKRLMRFTLVPCGDFAWKNNDDGRVETVVRYLTMTARQIAERYGEEAMSKRARRLLDENPEKRVKIVHMVRPRKNKKNAPDALNPMKMPWESLVWEACSNTFLHEGGYEELPHITARWNSLGNTSPYGCSPAMEILFDIQKLQKATRDQLLIVREATRPTEAASEEKESLFRSVMKYGWGWYYWPSPCKKDAPQYQIKPDIAKVGREIEDLRTAIRKGLFNDFFLAFTREAKPKTKQEMDARSEEVLGELSPVIERLQAELLDPLIERTYGMLKRAGMLPTPPCCMEGKALRVEYISPLAAAQRELAEKNLHAFFTDVQKTFCRRD